MNKRRKILIFLLVMVLLIGFAVWKLNEKGKQENYGSARRSLFSWQEEPFLDDRDDFYAVIEGLHITDIYQSVSDESLHLEETASFLDWAQYNNRDVYYLYGDLETRLSSIMDTIYKVSSYNIEHKGSGTFQGIVFDIEPYLGEAWDLDEESAMQNYLSAMKEAYREASKKGLTVVICIPNWFDSAYPKELKELIDECADIINVMNYDRENEISAIETETELAEKANKLIECSLEFQEVGKHELTENETYFNAGLKAAQNSFQSLYDAMRYKKMSLSYHYYKPIKKLYFMSFEDSVPE